MLGPAMPSTRCAGGLLLLGAVFALAACQETDRGPQDQASVAAPVVATSTPVPAGSTQPLGSFSARDGDGDGTIASAENATAMQATFQTIDADRSGTIDLAEVENARAALGSAEDIASPALISLADSDRDGKLVLSEWMAMCNAHFSAMDKSGDGAVDGAEWNARRMAPPPPA